MAKKLGVAIGGGGSWSIAGLGVIKTLTDQGLEISYLSGCSMGALIAAAIASNFAGGKTIDRAIELIEEINFRKALRPSRHHRFGFFSPENIGRLFVDKIGIKTFEQMRIPLKIIATDFRTGEPVVFEKGDLLPALNATTALTLVIAPYPYQGKLLTDGGVSMPIPIEVLKKAGAQVTIGIDSGSKRHLKRVDEPFSPWHLPILRVIPPLHYLTTRRTRKTFVQMTDLLFSNLTQAQLKACPPDFLLVPEVTHLSQFNFKKARELVEEGERVTRKILPDLQKALK